MKKFITEFPLYLITTFFQKITGRLVGHGNPKFLVLDSDDINDGIKGSYPFLFALQQCLLRPVFLRHIPKSKDGTDQYTFIVKYWRSAVCNIIRSPISGNKGSVVCPYDNLFCGKHCVYEIITGVTRFLINEIKVITEGALLGEAFVFTGYRNKALEEQIKNLGGKIGSSVSKKISYLVVKQTGSGSSKEKKALSLGIKIISGEECERMIAKLC